MLKLLQVSSLHFFILWVTYKVVLPTLFQLLQPAHSEVIEGQMQVIIVLATLGDVLKSLLDVTDFHGLVHAA